MLKLIQNEWMKLLNRPGTYVMLGLMILAIAALTAFSVYTNSTIETNDSDWRVALEAENEGLRQSIEEGGDAFYVQESERQLALNEYRLANDVQPSEGTTVWSYLESNSYLISLVGLFAIIVASGVVAGEFSWGTIKLLMIRPIARWKILLSKFITVASYGIAMIGILFVLSMIIGFIFFDSASMIHLSYQDGAVQEGNMILYLMRMYLLSSVDAIMLTTMAFMISAVFRNSSLAIGISLFLYFIGGTVTGILAMWFDWTKYILFANTGLVMYELGTPLVEGMTLTFSLIVLAVYFTIFIVLAFSIFTKRDIAS
ncbi:ABC transporter permease [Jeotgalibacillus soli]|uniref:ABC transporter permease n=1 Tax=Jeotgalibacillus soli TaxID=889306 RepID=A0A0C2V6C4_9BACL|nr:ABC transporter permease [Jeotgalibacillus soli]KIL44507.1 hypothetical protein KP78_34710 [Jeotgalibacillus soli]